MPSKPMTKINALYFVPIIKLINVTFSAVACATFLYFQRYAVVLEYTQIWFLSALVCVLDSEAGVFRNIYFALLTLVGAAWIVAAVYVESWHQPIYAKILLSFDAFVYMAGSIACAAAIVNRPTKSSAAAEKNRLIEIDLLIYVVSLNALSVFPVNAFNTNLHMVLDIRLVVLLYTGLYRPANKMELLNNVSFLVVMFSIVLFFAMYSISLDNPVIIACASVVNSTIGVVLLYQAWYHFYVVYPEDNNVPDIRNQNEKDETVDNNLSSSVESPLIE